MQDKGHNEKSYSSNTLLNPKKGKNSKQTNKHLNINQSQENQIFQTSSQFSSTSRLQEDEELKEIIKQPKKLEAEQEQEQRLNEKSAKQTKDKEKEEDSITFPNSQISPSSQIQIKVHESKEVINENEHFQIEPNRIESIKPFRTSINEKEKLSIPNIASMKGWKTKDEIAINIVGSDNMTTSGTESKFTFQGNKDNIENKILKSSGDSVYKQTTAAFFIEEQNNEDSKESIENQSRMEAEIVEDQEEEEKEKNKELFNNSPLNLKDSEKQKNQKKVFPLSSNKFNKSEYINEFNTEGTQASEDFKSQSISQQIKKETKCQKNTTKICNCMIISNQSKIKFYWDVLIVLCVIYDCFAIPFETAFLYSEKHSNESRRRLTSDEVNIVLDILFCFDVLFCFRTSYKNQDGEEILDGKIIASKYIKSGKFFFDLIGSFPIDRIVSAIFGNSPLIQLIQLLKLIRISRITRLIGMTKVKTEMKIIVRIICLVFMLFVLLHLNTCIWHLIVRNDHHWMPVKDAEREKTDVHNETMIVSAYMTQLYTSAMILVGIQVAPYSAFEHLYCVVVLLMSSILFAGVFNYLIDLFKEVNKKNNKFQEMFNEANNIMKNLNLPKNVREKVSGYLTQTYMNLYKQEELKKFLKLLSPNYRQVFSLHLQRDLLKKNNTLFQGLEKAKVLIIKKLKTQTYIPDQEIFRVGDVGTKMYFIGRGEVEIVLQTKQNYQHASINIYEQEDENNKNFLFPGDFFGEICLVLPNLNRTATAVANNFCTGASLEITDFNLIAEIFPMFRQKLQNHIQIKYEKTDVWKSFVKKHIQQIPYIKKLSQLELFQVIYSMKKVDYNEGVEITCKGERPDYLFLVLEGEIDFRFTLPKRPDLDPSFMTLGAGSAGFIFQCIDQKPILYNVVTNTPTKLLILQKDKLFEIGKDNVAFKNYITAVQTLQKNHELPSSQNDFENFSTNEQRQSLKGSIDQYQQRISSLSNDKLAKQLSQKTIQPIKDRDEFLLEQQKQNLLKIQCRWKFKRALMKVLKIVYEKTKTKKQNLLDTINFMNVKYKKKQEKIQQKKQKFQIYAKSPSSRMLPSLGVNNSNSQNNNLEFASLKNSKELTPGKTEKLSQNLLSHQLSGKDELLLNKSIPKSKFNHAKQSHNQNKSFEESNGSELIHKSFNLVDFEEEEDFITSEDVEKDYLEFKNMIIQSSNIIEQQYNIYESVANSFLKSLEKKEQGIKQINQNNH